MYKTPSKGFSWAAAKMPAYFERRHTLTFLPKSALLKRTPVNTINSHPELFLCSLYASPRTNAMRTCPPMPNASPHSQWTRWNANHASAPKRSTNPLTDRFWCKQKNSQTQPPTPTSTLIHLQRRPIAALFQFFPLLSHTVPSWTQWGCLSDTLLAAPIGPPTRPSNRCVHVTDNHDATTLTTVTATCLAVRLKAKAVNYTHSWTLHTHTTPHHTLATAMSPSTTTKRSPGGLTHQLPRPPFQQLRSQRPQPAVRTNTHRGASDPI